MMKKLFSPESRWIDLIAPALFVLILTGCPGPKDPNPTPPTQTGLKPNKTTVNQLELVELVTTGGTTLPTPTVTGTFGGRPVTLAVTNDTLVFLIPDVPAGRQILAFTASGKNFQTEYTVLEVKVTSEENTLNDFLSKIDAHVKLLEQALKIPTFPVNGMINLAGITEIKRTISAFTENLSKATVSERKELAKFLTANPLLTDTLAGLRISESHDAGDKFLAAVKVILSGPGAKAIILGTIGGILLKSAAGGFLPILLGAALLITAAATFYSAYLKIIGLAQEAVERQSLIDELWDSRLATREILPNKAYKILLFSKYRTLGKQDAANIALKELFDLNDKLVYFGERLRTFKIFSGTVFDLRKLESKVISVAVSAKDITPEVRNNPNVTISKKAISADTLYLSFGSTSKTNENFDLKLSFKTEEGETVTNSEAITLRAPEVTILKIIPDYIENYKQREASSEKITFKLEKDLYPVKWELLPDKNNALPPAGSVSQSGVFSGEGIKQIIGKLRLRATYQDQQGIAIINIVSGILKLQVNSYVKLPVTDAPKIVSGKCIGKLLSMEYDAQFGSYTLTYELTPQLGENPIDFSNPFQIPIGIDFQSATVPSNFKGIATRYEVPAGQTTSIKCILTEIVY